MKDSQKKKEAVLDNFFFRLLNTPPAWDVIPQMQMGTTASIKSKGNLQTRSQLPKETMTTSP